MIVAAALGGRGRRRWQRLVPGLVCGRRPPLLPQFEAPHGDERTHELGGGCSGSCAAWLMSHRPVTGR